MTGFVAVKVPLGGVAAFGMVGALPRLSGLLWRLCFIFGELPAKLSALKRTAVEQKVTASKGRSLKKPDSEGEFVFIKFELSGRPDLKVRIENRVAAGCFPTAKTQT